MQFASVSFIIFAAVTLALYYLVPKKAQWVVLLIASYFFYLWGGIEYLGFIVFTTITTYFTAKIMSKNLGAQDAFLAANKSTLSRDEKKAYKAKVKSKNRVFLILCLVLNFSLLFFCKGLLAEPFRTMAEGGRFEFLTLALPLGISFYMFQSLGYIIDVYRGGVKEEKNFFKFSLFVSFFPQLVQGPISKFSSLAPQLYAPHSFNRDEFLFGLERILWGFFKKLVIADRIAAAVIELKGPEYTGISFLVLTIFYAVQIYGDFTGGIDITIGLAQTMGITLAENFVRPYFSKNIAEYWRRWHITLSVWMKDYIFYPLSVSKPMLNLSKSARAKFGNFGKRLPVYVASIITWFCTGIWHGITPNFILWGMLNCFFIVLSEELMPLYDKFHNRFHLKDKKWYGGFEMLRMFMLMNLIRITDLFPDVSVYFYKMGTLFYDFNFNVLWDGTLMNIGLTALDYFILLGGIILMFAVSLYGEKVGSVRALLHRHYVIGSVCIFLLLLVVLLMGSYGIGYNASNFIYNQF